MHVALAQDQVLLAADLDLEAAVGREEHAIGRLDGPNGRARGDDLGPHEAAIDVCCGRDENPGARLAIAGLRRRHQEKPVGGHADRLFDLVMGVVVGLGRHRPRISTAHRSTAYGPATRHVWGGHDPASPGESWLASRRCSVGFRFLWSCSSRLAGLAACGGSGSGGGSGACPAKVDTKSAPGGDVTVCASDLKFDVSTIKAPVGQLDVTLENRGAVYHTFKIEGTSPATRADRTPDTRSDEDRDPRRRARTSSSAPFTGHAAGMKGKVGTAGRIMTTADEPRLASLRGIDARTQRFPSTRGPARCRRRWAHTSGSPNRASIRAAACHRGAPDGARPARSCRDSG